MENNKLTKACSPAVATMRSLGFRGFSNLSVRVDGQVAQTSLLATTPLVEGMRDASERPQESCLADATTRGRLLEQATGPRVSVVNSNISGRPTGRATGPSVSVVNSSWSCLSGVSNLNRHATWTTREQPSKGACHHTLFQKGHATAHFSAKQSSEYWALCLAYQSTLPHVANEVGVNLLVFSTKRVRDYEARRQLRQQITFHHMNLVIELPKEIAAGQELQTLSQLKWLAEVANKVFVIAPRSNPYWKHWEAVTQDLQLHYTTHSWCGMSIVDPDTTKPLAHHTRIASNTALRTHRCICGNPQSHVFRQRTKRSDEDVMRDRLTPHQSSLHQWANEILEILSIPTGGPLVERRCGQRLRKLTQKWKTRRAAAIPGESQPHVVERESFPQQVVKTLTTGSQPSRRSRGPTVFGKEPLQTDVDTQSLWPASGPSVFSLAATPATAARRRPGDCYPQRVTVTTTFAEPCSGSDPRRFAAIGPTQPPVFFNVL